MALDDFAPASSRNGEPVVPPAGVNPDDEDLFDFPVIETKKPGGAPAKATAPIASTSPAHPTAPLPAQKPAAAKTPSTLGVAPVHTIPPPNPAPRTRTEPSKKSIEAAPAVPPPAIALPIEQPDVGAALADAMGDDDASTSIAEVASRARFARSPAFLWTAALVLLSLNTAGFFFFWTSNHSFRSAIEGLRNDLAVAAHDMQLTSALAPAGSASGEPTTSSKAHDSDTAAPPRIPSFEDTAIDLARREIDLGRYAAARMRLYRLLALADRIDPGVRADVEARASFLIGESYAVEIDKRLEAEQ